MRILLAAITMALMAAACGVPPSLADLQPAPTAAIACLDLDRPRCEAIQRALPAQLPAGRAPQNVEISESVCDGPCFPAGVKGWRGHVKIEFLDAGEPLFLGVDVLEVMSWETIPTVSVSSVPRTAPILGSSADIEFGQCGYDEGIDADGSFWDPVGALTWDSLRRLNSSRARFTLESRRTATLRFDDGLTINLARHIGPKRLPGCD
jgi:hypothetical protein